MISVCPESITECFVTVSVCPESITECSVTVSVCPESIAESFVTVSVCPESIAECSVSISVCPESIAECSVTKTHQRAKDWVPKSGLAVEPIARNALDIVEKLRFFPFSILETHCGEYETPISRNFPTS